MKQVRRLGSSLAALVLMSRVALAGPVVLGGDDLNDHGSRDGGGNNQLGWVYIQTALTAISGQVTRPGPNTSDIAFLGSPQEVGCPATCTAGDASGAAGSAAANAGLSIAYFDGAAAITQFFADLAGGVVNPRIIYLPGTETSNDLDSTEGAVLTANAVAIRNFVASGGGLLSHGCDSSTDCAIAYGWLTTLIPGLQVNADLCDSNGAMLTSAGQTALPGVTDGNIDASAGPCHNSFSGNLGGLTVLALDGDTLPQAFILGGLVHSIGKSTNPAPVASPLGIAAVVLALGALGLRRSKRI